MIDIPYWREHINVGNYVIRYIHPENLEYTYKGSEQLYSVPIEAPSSSADFNLESTVTINKKGAVSKIFFLDSLFYFKN